MTPCAATTRKASAAHSSADDQSVPAALAFLVVAAQVVTYAGFYFALARWASARVFAWTFLVPAVAVIVEAAQGDLPSGLTVAGMVVVIAGVAMVTHPRAEIAPAR